jgi:hypothetical protein
MAEEQRHYHFPETLRMVAPRGTSAALDELADRRHIVAAARSLCARYCCGRSRPTA